VELKLALKLYGGLTPTGLLHIDPPVDSSPPGGASA